MQYTFFRYARHQQVPVVTAVLRLAGHSINVPLPFAVDTAAQRSIITPGCESRLRLAEPSLNWESMFRHGGVVVDTILTEATFKSYEDRVGLTFIAEDESLWTVELNGILFSDECRIGPSKIVVAKHLPFSILGQDVLFRCGLLSVGERGLITPDKKAVEKAIDRLKP